MQRVCIVFVSAVSCVTERRASHTRERGWSACFFFCVCGPLPRSRTVRTVHCQTNDDAPFHSPSPSFHSYATTQRLLWQFKKWSGDVNEVDQSPPKSAHELTARCTEALFKAANLHSDKVRAVECCRGGTHSLLSALQRIQLNTTSQPSTTDHLHYPGRPQPAA